MDLNPFVSIDFFGMQRCITNADSIAVPISGNTVVADILQFVRQQYPELPLDEKMTLIVVNQEMASLDTALMVNDRVSFLPLIGGG